MRLLLLLIMSLRRDDVYVENDMCRNLPFYGRARRGSRVRLPKEENARNRHQRLFVENVGKTEGNRSWRIFQIRELYLRLRKVLAPLTFVSKDNNLFFRIVKLCYLNFYFFLFFEVDKSGALAPTYPPSKRKSDLRSSFLRVNQAILFYLKGDHFKALDLKNDPFYLVRNWNHKLSKPYFLWTSLTRRVDFSLSFTLVISQFN